MATPFLSSEEYDERAHRLYDEGAYDSALETLKEGLRLYPHSVELYVGLGYTRLAREEFAWARQAFERGLVLDPEHEDALVGLGESLLRIGETEDAVGLFRRVVEGGVEDGDLLLAMGRALYRAQRYDEAAVVFTEGVRLHEGSADMAAGLGYTLHRAGDVEGARRELRRALRLDSEHYEARIYLGHLLYDRGEWGAALREFERVPPCEHHDALALARLLELRRSIGPAEPDSAAMACWEARLEELEEAADPLDALLAEVEEAAARGDLGVEEGAPPHRLWLGPDRVLCGTWYEIVRQIRDASGGHPGETVTQYMRRRSEEERQRRGVALPTECVHEFLDAGARAGLWNIER